MSNLVIKIAPEFQAEAQKILDAIDAREIKNKNKKRKIKQTKKAGKK